MATIINTPGATSDAERDSVISSIVIGLVLVILAVLFFVYALPALQNSAAPATNSTLNVEVGPGPGGTVSPTPTAE